MKRLTVILALITLVGIVPVFDHLSASIFKYSDREGKEHYTDSLESVPEAYRSKAVNMDKHLQKNPGFMIEPPKPKEPLGDIVKHKAMSFMSYWGDSVGSAWASTWSRTMALLVLSLVLFVFAGKIAKGLGNKHLSSVIRFALTTLVMVYLFHSYVAQISDDFINMRKNVLEVKQRADERNREMDRLIKSIVSEEERMAAGR